MPTIIKFFLGRERGRENGSFPVAELFKPRGLKEQSDVRVLSMPTMKLEFKNIKENPISILRQAGYFFQHREGNEASFIRPLAKAGYPRFHAHAVQDNKDLIIKIHLDQKKETYGKSARHHGEYENEGALKTEVERLKKFFG